MRDLALGARDDGSGIDFPLLRADRRARCLDEMERRDVDVLLLGRDANARYISGHRRLWFAGTRPFSPGCTVVRATGEVHLSSIHADGVPPEIGPDRLYAFSWNPALFLDAVRAIEGVTSARRIGVDGMTPAMAKLLAECLPDAELVNAEALLRRVRAVKTPEEIACIATAVAVSEAALEETASRIVVGATEKQLLAHSVAAVARRGAQVSMEGSCCATPAHASDPSRPPLRRLATERPLRDGELVALDVGALHAGYEGGVARTRSCGDGPPAAASLRERFAAVMDRLIGACEPGRPAAGLRDAYLASGEPLPPVPIAQGLGLGVEAPCVDPEPAADRSDRLVPGGVLSLQVYVWEAGVGGYFGRDVVVLGDAGVVRLTQLD